MHAYQTDIDQCKTWKVELLNYANSLQDLIRAVNGKTVEQMGDEAVKAAEETVSFEEKITIEEKKEYTFDDEKKEAVKELSEVNEFAGKLLSVINEARKKGWYRLELGYLKVNDDGLVIDRRIVNTKEIIFRTGERVWHLTTPPVQW